MTQMPVTKPTLLIRLKDPEDREAWQLFVELYGPVVYRLFRSRGVQDADAADLMQEVLSSICTESGLGSFDPGQGPFRRWLYGVIRNKFSDYLGREYASAGITSSEDAPQDVMISEDNLSERWDREYQKQLFTLASERVRTVVDESTWTAFWETAVEGKTASDVAHSLEMSIGAVYVAKSRVMARLKQIISQLNEDES